MRKLILLLIAALTGFVSCEKSDADAIIGTWEATSIEMTMEGMNLSFDLKEYGASLAFTFKANGEGSMTGTSDGESINDELDYMVDDGVLTIVYDGESQDLPITIDGRTMVMTVDAEMLDDDSFIGKIKIYFKKK